MKISIHIPKTAGTTVAYMLDYGLNRRIMYDYAEDYSDDPPTRFILKHKEFIEKYFDVIHGHFLYKKYASSFPDAEYISTVRHPVDRVISQYNHNLNLNPETATWPAKQIISGEIDLVEFSSLPNIGNAQSVFLGERAVDDYDFIFITENLEKSVGIYERMTGFRRADPFTGKGMPVINSHEVREKRYIPTEDEKRAIYRNTGQDNEIYQKSVEKLKTLQKKYI